MKYLLFLFPLIGLVACTDGGPASNVIADAGSSSSQMPGSSGSTTSFPASIWLQSEPEVDEGYTYVDYYCFTSDGTAQWVNVEKGAGTHDISWYPGDYSLSGATLSLSFTERASWSGGEDESPTDLATRSKEPLETDEIGISIGYSVSGSGLVLSDGEFSLTLTSVTNAPAYLATIPCN